MITLINPPGLKTFSGLNMHTPNPPLGLAYIAGTLGEAGLAYHVIDGVGEALERVRPYPQRTDFMIQGLSPEEIAERIPAGTDIIGVTCTFSTLWPLARMVPEAARARFPDALIVLGGEHGTAVPENVIETSPYDVVVLGEGEETFLALVAAHRNRVPLDTVPGICFRTEGRPRRTPPAPRVRAVDDIPLPDWELFPIEEYISRHQISGVNLGRSMPLLATRGCPYQCTFCSSPNMWTTRYIPRDPVRVVDEIELHRKKYNVTNFDFFDLTAVVKRSWAVAFCRELIERDLDITWQMPSGTRAEVFDAEVADLLYRSGCRVLAFAPESGSPEILEKVKKRVDLDKMLTAMRTAIGRGLKLSCFIVIGFPDDTPRTLRQTMALIRRMAALGVHDVAVTKFVPYPGSELFFELQKAGKIELDDSFFISPMDFYNRSVPSYAEAISSRRLYWTMIWMFLNFYVISFARRPVRTAAILWKAALQGTEETRFAKWFVDRFFVRRRWRKMARTAG